VSLDLLFGSNRILKKMIAMKMNNDSNTSRRMNDNDEHMITNKNFHTSEETRPVEPYLVDYG
jgi:hypothetical protein